MVDLTIDQNLPTEAFRFAERAKGRTLKMLLGSNRLRITSEMNAAEVANEQKLQKEKATLLSQYNREHEHGPQSPRLAELTLKLQKVEREYQAFEKNLYLLHPMLKLLRGEGEAVGAERLRVLLPSQNSAILEFVETDESLYLLAFSSGRTGVPRLVAYPLGLTRREAAERAVALQDLIVRRQSGWEPLARELYDRLLKPAETQLKGKTNLVIVPDGWLWNLPFATLQPVDGAFLIDAYSISVCSSVTAMNLMGLAKGRPLARTQLLAFGHPELTTAAKERMKVASRDEKFVAEEQTSAEVHRISELYGTAGSRTIGGADARSDRLREEASRSTRLHLAAPAVVNEASPLYSQIALAASPAIAGDAGVLQLRELLSWKMTMDLAVFSSSQIVPRGQSVGRGISGLSWTLLAAGTPTVLIGQWRVEGKTEGDLMLAFHRELRLSRQKALSWQRAAKEAIRNPDRRHPFNWAGYMLVGDGH
jgi:CHAT domain-containing protein